MQFDGEKPGQIKVSNGAKSEYRNHRMISLENRCLLKGIVAGFEEEVAMHGRAMRAMQIVAEGKAEAGCVVQTDTYSFLPSGLPKPQQASGHQAQNDF